MACSFILNELKQKIILSIMVVLNVNVSGMPMETISKDCKRPAKWTAVSATTDAGVHPNTVQHGLSRRSK